MTALIDIDERQGRERYERAVKRNQYVWGAILDLDFDAQVPLAFLEADGEQRKVKNDWSHSLVNVPVEFARWKWGWSQWKTKLLMPYVLIRIALR